MRDFFHDFFFVKWTIMLMLEKQLITSTVWHNVKLLFIQWSVLTSKKVSFQGWKIISINRVQPLSWYYSVKDKSFSILLRSSRIEAAGDAETRISRLTIRRTVFKNLFSDDFIKTLEMHHEIRTEFNFFSECRNYLNSLGREQNSRPCLIRPVFEYYKSLSITVYWCYT